MQVLVILVPSSKTLEPAALNAIAAAKLLGAPVTVLIAGIYQHRLAKHLNASGLVERIDLVFEKMDDFAALAKVLYQRIQTHYPNYQRIFFTKNDFGTQFNLLLQDVPDLIDMNYAQNLTEKQRVKIIKDAFDLKTKLIPPAKMPADFIAPEVHTDDSEQASSPSPEFKTLSKDMTPEHIRKVKKRARSLSEKQKLPKKITLPRSVSELSLEMIEERDELSNSLNLESEESEETDSLSEEPKKPEKHKRWRKFKAYFFTKFSKLKRKSKKEKVDSDHSRLRSVEFPSPNPVVNYSNHKSPSKKGPFEVYIWNRKTAAVVTDALGEGNLGSVVKTMDLDLQTEKVIPRSRAVKTLKSSSPPSEGNKRFSDEYYISAALSGSYGSIRDSLGNMSTFDMPYYEGIDLFSLIEKLYPLSTTVYDFKFRIKLIITICEELAKLHEMGVVHKDLKPENMLFNPETNEIYIYDWGFAITENSGNTDRCGSPDYISPEVLWRKDEPATSASDMFAVGIIIPMILGGLGTINQLWEKAQNGKVAWNECTIKNKLHGVQQYLYKETVYTENIIDEIISLLEFEPQYRPTAIECGEFFTAIYNTICQPEERKTFNENPNHRSSLGFYGFFMPDDSLRRPVKSLTVSDNDNVIITESSLKQACS